ncbi:MAG: hypothetical protein J7480_09720 [Microbacteriaceae bacterium]|nr:hypothetical protein [Microbacteriaceae bacterium]
MTPVQLWSLVSVLVVAIPGGILMIWGWRRRQRRQADIPALPAVPGSLGERSGSKGVTRHPASYVATTTAGEPTDRISVRGLAFRGRAVVWVAEEGVLIERTGEAAIWLERAALGGVGRATWTIDRVVEGDGLHLLRWSLDGQEFDTYLRLDEPAEFDAALRLAALAQRTNPEAGLPERAEGESKGIDA